MHSRVRGPTREVSGLGSFWEIGSTEGDIGLRPAVALV